MIQSQIPLQKIKIFSQCPRLSYFLQDKPLRPQSKIVSTTIQVAQKACLLALETEHRMDWKKIIELVDLEVFGDINFHDKQAFDNARRTAESVLNFLMYWYHTIYSKNILIYTSISVKIPKQNIVLTDIVQFVTSEPIPHIIEFGEERKEIIGLQNDIRIRSIMSYILDELESDRVKFTYYSIGPYGGHTVAGRGNDPTITCSRIECERSNEVLDQLVTAMRVGLNYPSVSDQCNLCQFKRRCII